MVTSWWSPNLKSALSQGDVLSPILIGSSSTPPTYLSKQNSKGGLLWGPTIEWRPEGDQTGYFLARGRVIHGIVISHDCEIDKKTKRSRILVAPISQISKVQDETSRQAILEQRRYALMPLPEIPNLGDYYADFRLLTVVDRTNADQSIRLASMSEDGVLRLQAQLIAFFTRRNIFNSKLG